MNVKESEKLIENNVTCYNCGEIIFDEIFYGDDGLEPYCEKCMILFELEE